MTPLLTRFFFSVNRMLKFVFVNNVHFRQIKNSFALLCRIIIFYKLWDAFFYFFSNVPLLTYISFTEGKIPCPSWYIILKFKVSGQIIDEFLLYLMNFKRIKRNRTCLKLLGRSNEPFVCFKNIKNIRF